MASKQAIAGVLAYLHELYPTREIGPATAEAWSMTFAEWDDAVLQSCAQQAARTHGRTFFPTPGEIAAFLPESVPVFDGNAILRKIEKLSTYSPQVGMIPPLVSTVRAELGDLVADAYAASGTSRVLSDDETTRNIAQRDFAKNLAEFAKIPDQVRLIASSPEPRRIASRKQAPQSVAAITASIMKEIPVPTP